MSNETFRVQTNLAGLLTSGVLSWFPENVAEHYLYTYIHTYKKCMY